MKITEITYRRLVTIPGEFGNESVGATAQVDWEYETAKEGLEKLIEWVETELHERGLLRERTRKLRVEKDYLEQRICTIRNLQRENDELRATLHMQEIEENPEIPF